MYINNNGYMMLDFYDGNERIYISEHKLNTLINNSLKDVFDKDIHHKNGFKLDNRVENLEVIGRSEHLSLHNTDREVSFKTRQKNSEENTKSYKTYEIKGDNKMIEEITDRLNGLEILIDERIKDIKKVSNFISKNIIQLNQLEYELGEVEFDIRTNINWKNIGYTDKEEMDLYIKTRDEYKLILFDIQRINNDIIEYKQVLNVLEKELKFYNRMYDRYSKLEDNSLSKTCKCGGNHDVG